MDDWFSGLIGALDLGVQAKDNEDRYQKGLEKIQQLKQGKEEVKENGEQKFILDMIDKSLDEISQLSCDNDYPSFKRYINQVKERLDELQKFLTYCSIKGLPEYVKNLALFIDLCLINFKTNLLTNQQEPKKYSEDDHDKVVGAVKKGINIMKFYVITQFKNNDAANSFIANNAMFLKNPQTIEASKIFNIDIQPFQQRGVLSTVANIPWAAANAGSGLFNRLLGRNDPVSVVSETQIADKYVPRGKKRGKFRPIRPLSRSSRLSKSPKKSLKRSSRRSPKKSPKRSSRRSPKRSSRRSPKKALRRSPKKASKCRSPKRSSRSSRKNSPKRRSRR